VEVSWWRVGWYGWGTPPRHDNGPEAVDQLGRAHGWLEHEPNFLHFGPSSEKNSRLDLKKF
jgi:hypothetical protein